ncbi:hypothetical protein [Caldiplasma sukawensis]
MKGKRGGQRGRGRGEKFRTVESIVSLLLAVPNQTRKDIFDKITGKRDDYIEGLPEWLTVNDKRGRRRISRQAVYKALKFLEDAGILTQEMKNLWRVKRENHVQLNRYTVKGVFLSIDMDEVWKRMMELSVEEFRKSQKFRILSQNAKEMVIQQMQRYFSVLNELDMLDKRELLHFIDEEYKSGKNGDDGVEMYMKLQDFDAVMEYLRMYAKKIRATPQ